MIQDRIDRCTRLQLSKYTKVIAVQLKTLHTHIYYIHQRIDAKDQKGKVIILHRFGMPLTKALGAD